MHEVQSYPDLGVSKVIDEKIINRQLKDRFGAQDNKPNFRLARTNDADQLEYRRMPWGDIDCRPKYEYLNGNFWVLERLMRVDGANAQMLPGATHSYEPVFVFRNSRTGEPAAVIEDVVFAIIHTTLFRQEARTKRDWEAEELAFYEKQVDRAHQFIADECSAMSTQLHFGEAVVKGEPKDASNDSVVRPETDSRIQAGPSITKRDDSSGSAE